MPESADEGSDDMSTDPNTRLPRRWQALNLSTERVVLEGIRAIVALGIISAMTALGINGAVDGAAVTGVLGAVVGAFGAQAGAAAASRAAARIEGPEVGRHTNGGDA